MTEPDYSLAIGALSTHIQEQGVAVNLFAFHLEDGVAGRCHYPDEPDGPLIELNEPRASFALMALAHEWGHFLSYREMQGLLADLPVEQREILAFWFGWDALVQVGAPISRTEWFTFHFCLEHA